MHCDACGELMTESIVMVTEQQVAEDYGALDAPETLNTWRFHPGDCTVNGLEANGFIPVGVFSQ